KLALNNLRLNSQQPIELSSALVNWPSLPDIEIKQLMLTNGTIESPNLKASELNLTLTNLALVQGKIASEQSRLHLDADTLIYNEQQFQQTNVELALSPSSIMSNELVSHWQKGRLQLSGHWQDKQLT